MFFSVCPLYIKSFIKFNVFSTGTYLGVNTSGKTNFNFLFKLISKVCKNEKVILISFLGGIFPIFVINKSLLTLVELGVNSSVLITVEPLDNSLTYLILIFFFKPTNPLIIFPSISASIPSKTWYNPLGNLKQVSKYSS